MNSQFSIFKLQLRKLCVFAFTFLTLTLTLTQTAYAVCPVCTVAVAAGLGLSRWLGIDDTVSGLWIGALILSSSFWFYDWLNKKNFKWTKKFPAKYHLATITILMYLLVLVPLAWSDIIGHPLNKILGIDKLLFGSAVGSFLFLAAVWADKKVRKIRGKQLFIYQKVVFPVSALIIGSVVMYFLTK